MTNTSHIFVGDKLRLGRLFNSCSLEDVGSKIGATRQYIHQLETEAKQPTSDTVAALAHVLSVSELFFYTPISRQVIEDQCHFRKRFTTPNTIIQQTIARGTLVDIFVNEISRYICLPEVNFPDRSVNSLADAEAAADECRHHWGLGTTGPIINMTRVVENAGAVVTHFDGLSDRVDALSIHRPRPIIVRNIAKESVSRQRFDVAHECGHLVMHRGIETGDRETEDQANRFASAFLLPRNAFAHEFPQSGNLNWRALYEMKLRWKVSLRAIVRRAYDLELIDSAMYRRANVHLMKTGQAKRERYDAEMAMERPELLTDAVDMLERDDKNVILSITKNIGVSNNIYEKVIGRTIDLNFYRSSNISYINSN